MANVMTNPTNFAPARISMYCPAMRYSSDVNYNGMTRVSFGSPAVASATNILSAQSINTAVTVDLTSSTINAVLDAPYGRALQVVASGAATSTVQINGYDYLGQPMTETLTLNGATPVLGKKAFKYLRNAVCGLTAGTTINLGTQNIFGLPYKTIKVDHETSDQALVAAGTLAEPVLTDPQTATTGDPRGTYTPTTTPDGSKVLTCDCMMQNDVNTSNRGGLHGIAQFSS